MSTKKPRNKRFLGHVLKASLNLGEVWMNENTPGAPFICIAHRGTWTITVSIADHKFEGEGPTERKARIDFVNRLVMLRQAIVLIERWSGRK